MNSLVSRWTCLAISAVVSTVAVTLVAGSRLEYCGQPRELQPRVNVVASRGPTLAPPVKTVFIQVQADQSELEIGWAGN